MTVYEWLSAIGTALDVGSTLVDAVKEQIDISQKVTPEMREKLREELDDAWEEFLES